jgi:hypothetical protein
MIIRRYYYDYHQRNKKYRISYHKHLEIMLVRVENRAFLIQAKRDPLLIDVCLLCSVSIV